MVVLCRIKRKDGNEDRNNIESKIQGEICLIEFSNLGSVSFNVGLVVVSTILRIEN